MKTKYCIFYMFLFVLPFSVQAVENDTIKVVLRSNVKANKIQLRWAVNSSAAWYFTNKNGFNIVRYTLLRDSAVLDKPERITLTPAPIKPKPLNEWQHIATTDNYAAIIAQALYGKSFEVSGGKAGISQIIALSQEQEQRFAMSLLAADMSFPAAVFAGWGYEDTSVKKNEKYLYQVIPANTTDKHTVSEGASYTGLGDLSAPPRPVDLSAVWGNGSVMLTWNYKLLLPYFNAYHLDRSEDGKTFSRLSKTPLINIMGNDRMFYTDSITNGKTYYYRILGVTPFGDISAPSDSVSGKGTGKLIYIPYIREVLPDDKGGVYIKWDFDERGNAEITGFELRQTPTLDSGFTVAISNIPPTERTVLHEKPLPEGYITIAAIAAEGVPTVSFPRLLQMEDTVPPAVPIGLNGVIDTLGVVRLSWKMNTDPDFYGYRIYRGQTKGEELIPLNNDAHKRSEFTDTVQIYNLNSKVYYAVASLDRRYNQSKLCETVEIEKPDVVKPSPPYITGYETAEEGIRIKWVRGRDERTLVSRIYRKEKNDEPPRLIAEIKDTSVVSYLDTSALNGTTYTYFVKTATKNGLESDASPEIAIKSQTKAKSAAGNIINFTAKRLSGGIFLVWEHDVSDVRSISIYRKTGEGKMSLWRSEFSQYDKNTADTAADSNTPYEYLLVIKNQKGIVFSKKVSVK